MSKGENRGPDMANEMKRNAIDADLREPKRDQRTTRSGEVAIRWKLGLRLSRSYPLPLPQFVSFLDIPTIRDIHAPGSLRFPFLFYLSLSFSTVESSKDSHEQVETSGLIPSRPFH